MGAKDRCSVETFEAFKDALTALGVKDAKTFRTFADKYDEVIKTRGMDVALKLAEADHKKRMVVAAEKKRATVFNADAFANESARLEKRHAKDPYQGLIALLNGTIKDTDSVFNGQRGKAAEWLHGMEHDFAAAGIDRKQLLKRFANDAEFDVAVSEARVRINEGGSLEGIPAEAVKVSQIFKKWDDLSREAYNAAGGRIGKLDSRGQPIDHNSSAIINASRQLRKKGIDVPEAAPKDRDANFKAWGDYVLRGLDEETTFAEFIDLKTADPEAYRARVARFMRTTWEAITTDVSMSHPGIDGPQNEGTRLAHSKVLHFKTARDGAEYNRIFGHSTQLDAYSRLIDRRARSTALMERLGPSARGTLDKLWEYGKKLAENNPKAREKFRDKAGIDALFANIDGSANMVGSNRGLAAVSASARAFAAMTRLWGVTLTSLSDLGYRGRDAALAGVPMLDRWASYADTFVRMDKVDRERLASAFGVGLTVRTGDFARRWSGESIDGRMGRAMAVHANLNLLTHWTDGARLSHDKMMASHLHGYRHKDFDALPSILRDDLDRHGITAQEWDVLVEVGEDAVGDFKLFTSEKVMDADLGAFGHIVDVAGKEEGVANRMLGKARADLARKLRTFYVDHAYSAVVEPDALRRSWLNRGLKRGDPLRELASQATMFLSFPLQVFSGPFQAALQSGHPMRNMAALLLTTAWWGFVASNLKAFARGRQPNLPEEPAEHARYFAKLIAQGGGLGIFGDYIYNIFIDEHGRDVQDMVAGPLAQDIGRIGAVGRKAISGDFEGAGKDFLNETVKHFPNTFYTKLIWELYVASMIRETLEPGWQERLERQSEGRTGEKPMIPTYERVPRGGLRAMAE